MDTLLKTFITRHAAHPRHDALTYAYECYLRGHIPEGVQALGMVYTGQSPRELLALIEQA